MPGPDASLVVFRRGGFRGGFGFESPAGGVAHQAFCLLVGSEGRRVERAIDLIERLTFAGVSVERPSLAIIGATARMPMPVDVGAGIFRQVLDHGGHSSLLFKTVAFGLSLAWLPLPAHEDHRSITGYYITGIHQSPRFLHKRGSHASTDAPTCFPPQGRSLVHHRCHRRHGAYAGAAAGAGRR